MWFCPAFCCHDMMLYWVVSTLISRPTSLKWWGGYLNVSACFKKTVNFIWTPKNKIIIQTAVHGKQKKIVQQALKIQQISSLPKYITQIARGLTTFTFKTQATHRLQFNRVSFFCTVLYLFLIITLSSSTSTNWCVPFSSTSSQLFWTFLLAHSRERLETKETFTNPCF